jgi:cyclophilin family peptidyl-prolyl cis-trans isomerase
MHVRCLAMLAVCLSAQTVAFAAPEKASARAEFVSMYGEWKQLLAKLYQLRDRYVNDSTVDKKAIEAEYKETLEKAKAMSDPLSAAAEQAYLAAPNEDKELNALLVSTLTGYVASDDYEKADKLARILVDNQFEAKELNLLAGLSFFATNDFEDAEKYLKLASDSGTINRNGQLDLRMIDKYKGLWEKESKIRKAEDKANNLPKVKLTTSKGDIVVLLLENEAPIATANFVSLVEKKYYDGLTFHRVLPGFMAQGGDPKGDGSGGPGYTIPDECRQDNHRVHFRGSLSMAKSSAPDSGGSQFFLTFLPTSHLDGMHTVFGRVIEGFDVLAKLQRTEPGAPGTPDKIVKATVLSKRPHKYEPVKRFDKK